jgi:hypothetical protein
VAQKFTIAWRQIRWEMDGMEPLKLTGERRNTPAVRDALHRLGDVPIDVLEEDWNGEWLLVVGHTDRDGHPKNPHERDFMLDLSCWYKVIERVKGLAMIDELRRMGVAIDPSTELTPARPAPLPETLGET